MAVRHSSPSSSRNKSPRPRTCIGRVGGVGVAAAQGEATDNRNAPRPEYDRFREAHALAVALKKTADGDALGMIAAKPGVNSLDPLKTVDETRRRQSPGTEPTAQIEKECGNGQNDGANARQSCGAAAFRPGRGSFFCGGWRVICQLRPQCDRAEMPGPSAVRIRAGMPRSRTHPIRLPRL